MAIDEKPERRVAVPGVFGQMQHQGRERAGVVAPWDEQLDAKLSATKSSRLNALKKMVDTALFVINVPPPRLIDQCPCRLASKTVRAEGVNGITLREREMLAAGSRNKIVDGKRAPGWSIHLVGNSCRAVAADLTEPTSPAVVRKLSLPRARRRPLSSDRLMKWRCHRAEQDVVPQPRQRIIARRLR